MVPLGQGGSGPRTGISPVYLAAVIRTKNVSSFGEMPRKEECMRKKSKVCEMVYSFLLIVF